MARRDPSRRDRHAPSGWRWVLVLLLSLGVHGLLVWWVTLPRAGGPRVPVRGPEAVRVEILRAPPPKPKPKPETPPKGQIVDIAPPPEPQPPPKDARHLAPFNRKVPEERKARRPSRRRPHRKPASKVAVQRPSKVRSPASKSPEPTELPKPAPKEELPSVEETARRDRRGAVPSRRPTPRRRVPFLLPATSMQNELANVQAFSGAGGSDDALPHIRRRADETDLNARQFRYWGFFQRVKELVRQQWHPVRVHRRYDPTGQVWGARDRLTILAVTLDRRGKVVDVKVVRRSGATPLDLEAVRAMRAASPFPNPPDPLFDDDGKLRFQFGFLLEIGRSGPRFFWKRL